MTDPDDGAPEDVDDEELAEMAGELSTVLRELRDELRAAREAREAGAAEPSATGGGGGGTGERGLPDIPIDMPSATDVLAFTDEKLIPAAITILEVNIRALELLQKGIRWARPDRAGENAARVRSHAESVSRSSLKRLDTVLADLQDAAGEGALPDDAEASSIIGEARRLRDEIDRALEERAEARDEDEVEQPAEEPEDEGPPSPWDEPPEVDVDVEGELESIKAELGTDDEDDDESEGAQAEEGEEQPEDDEDPEEVDDVSEEEDDDPDEDAGDADAGNGEDSSDE